MSFSLSHTSRKRRHDSINEPTHSDNSDDNNNNHDKPLEGEDLPSKRLRNSQGDPTPIPQLHLATHKILSSLAFSRLNVTANYAHYNPHASPVLLCVIRSDDELYRWLCNIAPTLYSSSASLQILCLMPSDQIDTSFWAHQQRLIPIFTAADLHDDEEASDEVRDFLVDRLPSTATDCVVLFDAEGRGVWVSGEVGSAGVEGCRDGLVKALKDLESSDQGFQEWEDIEME